MLLYILTFNFSLLLLLTLHTLICFTSYYIATFSHIPVTYLSTFYSSHLSFLNLLLKPSYTSMTPLILTHCTIKALHSTLTSHKFYSSHLLLFTPHNILATLYYALHLILPRFLNTVTFLSPNLSLLTHLNVDSNFSLLVLLMLHTILCFTSSYTGHFYSLVTLPILHLFYVNCGHLILMIFSSRTLYIYTSHYSHFSFLTLASHAFCV